MAKRKPAELTERQQVAEILDGLDGLFGDPTDKPQGPVVRVLHGDPLAETDATDAQQWQPRIDVIRKWSRGESVSWRRTAGTNAAKSAAEQMQLLLPGPGDANLAAVYSTVCRLFELIASVAAVGCQCCGKTFQPGRAGETHCQTCKTNRGNYGEIWTALHCFWHHRQPIRPTSEADWDDFRTVFLKRYGTLPEESAKGWAPIPKVELSRQSPPLWERFELDCRERLLAAGASRDHWDSELYRTPIAEVVKWMRAEPQAVAKSEGGGGPPRSTRQRKRKPDLKAAERRKAQKQQRAIDDWIWDKWHGEHWESAEDFSHTMKANGKLPPGFTGELDAGYVRALKERTRKRNGRLGKSRTTPAAR